MPTFTTDWLTPHLHAWETHLGPWKGKAGLAFLEIGCFEGRASCWLLEHVLTDPSSGLTCIDTFEPMEIWPIKENPWPSKHAWEHKSLPFEDRFDANIRELGAEKKVQKLRGVSNEILRTLPFSSFDLVFIDGSHRPQDVLRDTILSWDLLKPGGIMIFDDYLLHSVTHPYHGPRIAIDAFLSVFSGRYNTLHSGWQMLVRKREDAQPSQPEETAKATTFLGRLTGR